MGHLSTHGDRHGATWKRNRPVHPGNRWGDRLLGWLTVALQIATLIVWAEVVGQVTQALLDSSDSDVTTRPRTYHVASTTPLRSH
jgi:hypothetical protein